MVQKLKKLIEIVTTASPKEVKQAQIEIEKYLHDFIAEDHAKRNIILNIFLDEIKKFDSIFDTDHQCYFINVLKWPFFYVGDKYFDEFSDFILICIQNPSGKIRQSIIKAADWLIMSLNVSRISYSQANTTDEGKKIITTDLLKFCRFVDKVGKLSEQYYLPRYKRIKYISSLPVSEYKSIQKLLMEVLLRSESYEQVYDDYLRRINHDDAVADLKIVLPEIKLRYLKRSIDGRKLTYLDAICSVCGKKDIAIGATKKPFLDSSKVICEDCAIDEYQARYGFMSREAATAHRRRIFDVGYLLQEMVIDKYLRQNKIEDYGELDIKTMKFLGEVSHNLYNDNFSREEKIVLGNEPNQNIIESKIRNVLGG